VSTGRGVGTTTSFGNAGFASMLALEDVSA
jgi:hypothetical protein